MTCGMGGGYFQRFQPRRFQKASKQKLQIYFRPGRRLLQSLNAVLRIAAKTFCSGHLDCMNNLVSARSGLRLLAPGESQVLRLASATIPPGKMPGPQFRLFSLKFLIMSILVYTVINEDYAATIA